MTRTALLLAALLAVPTASQAAEIARYKVTVEGNNGRYLIADNDSDRSMRADSTDPTGSREHFTLIEQDDGRFALQAYHGHFVVAERDDHQRERRVMADRAFNGSFEHFESRDGSLEFSEVQYLRTAHGTQLARIGGDLKHEELMFGSANNRFRVHKEGFAARFLDPDGHTQRANGSVDYVGDVEVPGPKGQSLLLQGAEVNYVRSQFGVFTRFSGTSDAPVVDVDGLGGQLGTIAGGTATFDLLNPSNSWPTSVPRGEKYLRIYNTDTASWGPIGIRPTNWGKRAMVFDHNDATMHIRGYIDFAGAEDLAWMSIGDATGCDVALDNTDRTAGDYTLQTDEDVCMNIDAAALLAGDNANVVQDLDVLGEATLGYINGDRSFHLPLADAVVVVDAAQGTSEFVGSLNGDATLPVGIPLIDPNGTVDGTWGQEDDALTVDVTDTALGDTLDAQALLFSGQVQADFSTGYATVQGGLALGPVRLAVNWTSRRNDPTAVSSLSTRFSLTSTGGCSASGRDWSADVIDFSTVVTWNPSTKSLRIRSSGGFCGYLRVEGAKVIPVVLSTGEVGIRIRAEDRARTLLVARSYAGLYGWWFL
jgi:hypothetical protein